MRRITLPFVLGACLALPGPVMAQDLGQAITGIAQSLLQQELDRTAYAEAQRLDTVAAYRNYLDRFPRGAFRTEAERALVRLGAGTAVPLPAPVPTPTPLPAPSVDDHAAAEAAIGLTRAQRLRIQTELTRLGHDTRGADGVWGRNTRTAIAAWQGANDQPVTGYVTSRQVRMIGEQAARLEPVAPAPPAAELEERALGLTESERREIQLRLTLLGYETTQRTDGTFGAPTRRAVTEWQRAQGLPATGFLTADQIRLLQRLTRG